MAHYQQTKFVEICKKHLPENFQNSNVIEVGSGDINGSVRSFFLNCSYIGVDVSPGPGVDLVCPGQDVALESNSYDTVISCECFEHNKFWLETFSNMIRMLKPGGLCIITCASIARGEHGTDRCVNSFSLASRELGMSYYGNLDRADFVKSGLLKNFKIWKLMRNIYSRDIYFVGLKSTNGAEGFLKSSRLEAIETDAKRIENSVGFMDNMGKRLDWILRYILARVLGEKNYHNLMYRAKVVLGR